MPHLFKRLCRVGRAGLSFRVRQEFSSAFTASVGEFRTDAHRFNAVKGASFDGHRNRETFPRCARGTWNPAARRFFVDRNANSAGSRLWVSVILVIDQNSRAILFKSFARVGIFAAPGCKERAWRRSPQLMPQQFC